MPTRQTVFSQIVARIHPQLFARCVRRHQGERKVRHFSCWDQFLCLAFAQLTYRESLRDIETCLRSRGAQLYHLGFRAPIARSTLADANEARDWRIFADLAQALIVKARRAYAQWPLEGGLLEPAYALDSSTIDLCLSLFPWAGYSRTQAGVKLHTLLDLHGAIPSFLHVTDAKTHDINALDWLLIEPGAFYVMDRGYLDYHRLYQLHGARAFFVVRAKRNLHFIRHHSRAGSADTIRSDQVGVLRSAYAHGRYPEKLRRVHVCDPQNSMDLVLLTNHFELPASVIAQLYRSRWQVELFFKWIKQHLRIKTFYGRSFNAVKTQIWSAACVYVLVAHLHRELRTIESLHSFLQVLSVNIFAQVPVAELLCPTKPNSCLFDNCNQLAFRW